MVHFSAFCARAQLILSGGLVVIPKLPGSAFTVLYCRGALADPAPKITTRLTNPKNDSLYASYS